MNEMVPRNEPRPWPQRTAAGTAALLGAVAIFQVVVVLGTSGALYAGGRQVGVLGPAGRVLAAVSAVLLVLMAVVIIGRVARAWRPGGRHAA